MVLPIICRQVMSIFTSLIILLHRRAFSNVLDSNVRFSSSSFESLTVRSMCTVVISLDGSLVSKLILDRLELEAIGWCEGVGR